LHRLIDFKIVTLSKERKIYIRDKIVLASVIAASSTTTAEGRLNNIRGSGLESMAKSIGKQILVSLNVKDAENMSEISIGYGYRDLDLVYSNTSQSVVAIFSCKVHAVNQSTDFFQNVFTHFDEENNQRMFYIILCSIDDMPSDMFGKYTEFRNQYKNMYIRIEPVNMSTLVPKLAKEFQRSFVIKNHNWPYLRRTELIESLKMKKHRIIHILGMRRVGKTNLVKEAKKIEDLYIDLKILKTKTHV